MSVMPHIKAASGFSFLEALIAAALVAGAIATLAHLVMRAAEQTSRSEQATVAAVLAQAKLEELRAMAFRYEMNGNRVDDPALAPSAPNTLVDDSPPHVEALDRFGQAVEAGAVPAYVRRWSIATAPLDPDTLILAACVAPTAAKGPSDACVWGIRVRRP
jgi:Tfp pilus assembly protein PilV